MAQPTQDTFATVSTEIPPVMDAHVASTLVDDQDTFIDTLENADDKIELPVPGGLAIQPNVMTFVRLSHGAKAPIVGTFDTHEWGSPTLVSGFVGINPYTKITPDMVEGWTDKNNPLSPDATFGFAQYREWIQRFGEKTVWPNHALIGTPFHRIHPPVFAQLMKNPRRILWSKGSELSQVIPGFAAESFSAERMSTGESLGLAAFLLARGITTVKVAGIDGDFCAGETAGHLAEAGLEVWVCVDAVTSLSIPVDGGGTTGTLRVAWLKARNVHFYKTEDDLAVNGQLLK